MAPLSPALISVDPILRWVQAGPAQERTGRTRAFDILEPSLHRRCWHNEAVHTARGKRNQIVLNDFKGQAGGLSESQVLTYFLQK